MSGNVVEENLLSSFRVDSATIGVPERKKRQLVHTAKTSPENQPFGLILWLYYILYLIVYDYIVIYNLLLVT
jgi:hypothetical protein